MDIYIVKSEGRAAEYDVYDEWVVLASNAKQAVGWVRQHDTYGPDAEPLVIDSSRPVNDGVAYSSFHPG